MLKIIHMSALWAVWIGELPQIANVFRSAFPQAVIGG